MYSVGTDVRSGVRNHRIKGVNCSENKARFKKILSSEPMEGIIVVGFFRNIFIFKNTSGLIKIPSPCHE